MNLFLFDDDTAPLPPVSTHQSFQRVIAAFDGFSRPRRPKPPFTVRPREDVLVDAKAVDERVRAGQRLPLAGTLVVAPARPLLSRRLARAGAVVVGTTGDGPGTIPTALTLGGTDAVVVPEPPARCGDLVAFTPTPGLVPGMRTVTVLARDIDIGQRVAAALTGPDPADPGCRDWPDTARLSAGEHPRIAVGDDRFTRTLDPGARRRLAATTDTLRAAGARLEEFDFGAGNDAGDGDRTRRTAAALREHDAVLLPPVGDDAGVARLSSVLDIATVRLPDGGPYGIGVLTKAFDDQVALDLAGLLTGAQAATPYPTIGVDLVAFGAYLRGQPRHAELARVGARFAGFVSTAPHYRMFAIRRDPPEAGIVLAGPHRPGTGVPLVAERWLLSPAALGEFVAHLSAPMRLGNVELADGSSALAVLCDPSVAQRGTEVTSWGCWRAYLRHLSTQRPVGSRAPG